MFCSRVLQVVFSLIFSFFISLPEACAQSLAGAIIVLDTNGSRISLLVDGANSDIKTGSILKQGSVILTGSDSSVDLLFENGVVLRVQPNSEFTIDEFQVSPYDSTGVDHKTLTNEPMTSDTRLKLEVGTVITSSKKLQEASSFQISTPIGATGIRGTKFFVETSKRAGKAAAMVGVTEGLIEFVTLSGNRREVAAGETLSITETAAGDAFTPDPPAAAELLPLTDAVDAQLRQAVPEKAFEGSEAAKAFVDDYLSSLHKPISPEMIRVQGGTLPSQSKLAGQRIQTFFIGNYEVTLSQWRKVQSWALRNGYDLKNEAYGASGDHPATELNWYDALKWCNAKSEMERLQPVYMLGGKVYKTGEPAPEGITVKNGAKGYRLPTSAEWEWAARGGIKSKGYTYAGSNDLDEVGWYEGNSTGKPLASEKEKKKWRTTSNTRQALLYYPTQQVGQKKPNELEIFDMSGNACEWIWGSDKIVIGAASRDPVKLFNLDGFKMKPTFFDSYLGFRIARSL